MKIYNNKEQMEILETSISANLPTLIRGETGVGKTTMITVLAEQQKKTLIRINVNGQTGREEIVGKYVLKSGATVWQDGVLLTAIKKGHWILFDEINAALPEILFILQALTESKNGELGNLTLVEKDGKVIKPHKETRIFATCNPSDYLGTKDFNMATLSRFIVIDMLNLSLQNEKELLAENFQVKTTDIEKLSRIASLLRDKKKAEEISVYVSTRELVQACQLLEKGLPLHTVVKISIINKSQSEMERKFITTEINGILSIPTDEIETELINMADMQNEIKKLQNELSKGGKQKQAIIDFINGETDD